MTDHHHHHQHNGLHHIQPVHLPLKHHDTSHGSQTSPDNTTTTSTANEKPLSPTTSSPPPLPFQDFISLKSTPLPFAGRLGGNQDFVLDPRDPETSSLLSRIPDAAPWMTYREALSTQGFREPTLYKQGLIEGIGTLALVYATCMLGISPSLNLVPLPPPSPTAGPYSTTNFLGPLVGSITNVLIVSLFVYALGGVTGAHLNPLITFSTFCVRLTSLPRAVIYMTFQILGAVLAGLLVRASFGTPHFKVGGCFYDPLLVGVRQVFTMEVISQIALLFLAFGVGLDPRQLQAFGPALAPALVGLSLGVMTLATATTVRGFGGAGMNPARCLAVVVGSGGGLGVTGRGSQADASGGGDIVYEGRNGGVVWVHFVAMVVSSLVHAVAYLTVPPWGMKGTGDQVVAKPVEEKERSSKV